MIYSVYLFESKIIIPYGVEPEIKKKSYTLPKKVQVRSVREIEFSYEPNRDSESSNLRFDNDYTHKIRENGVTSNSEL